MYICIFLQLWIVFCWSSDPACQFSHKHGETQRRGGAINHWPVDTGAYTCGSFVANCLSNCMSLSKESQDCFFLKTMIRYFELVLRWHQLTEKGECSQRPPHTCVLASAVNMLSALHVICSCVEHICPSPRSTFRGVFPSFIGEWLSVSLPAGENLLLTSKMSSFFRDKDGLTFRSMTMHIWHYPGSSERALSARGQDFLKLLKTCNPLIEAKMLKSP